MTPFSPRRSMVLFTLSCRDSTSAAISRLLIARTGPCWMTATCDIFVSVGCSAPPTGASSESPVAPGLFAVCSTGCLNRGHRELTSASTSQ